MAKIIFTGGSITSGWGWGNNDIENKTSHNLWVNLLHTGVKEFQNLSLYNLGIPGESNTSIFKETVKAISQFNDIKYIFCSWVSAPRYCFNVGFELYNTLEMWHPNDSENNNRQLNNLVLSRKYLNNIKNRFLTLHHLHYEILKIVEYVNIINALCKSHNITVYHINDSCSWDKNYFTKLNNVLPSEYTEFTKSKIINVSTRDDEEIFSLYEKMHSDYESCGGICYDSWINLYESFLEMQVDTNNDLVHPGIKSNLIYYTQIKNFIASRNIH